MTFTWPDGRNLTTVDAGTTEKDRGRSSPQRHKERGPWHPLLLRLLLFPIYPAEGGEIDGEAAISADIILVNGEKRNEWGEIRGVG